MTPAFARLAALLALATAAATVVGCGDPGLWARWRAERMLWHARRAADHADPRDAAAAARAGAALGRVVAAFPAAAWTTPEALRRRYGADIARISGDAALRRADLAHAAHAPEAATQYAAVARDYAPLAEVAAPASMAEARAHAESGDERAALEAWSRVLARDEWVLRPEWAQAGGEAVQTLESSGHRAEADSVRANGIDRLDRALAAAAPGTGVESWRTLAGWRADAGDWDGGRATLRAALAGPATAPQREAVVLDLVEHSERAGAPDTAAAYAAWAATGVPAGDRVRGGAPRGRGVGGPVLRIPRWRCTSG